MLNTLRASNSFVTCPPLVAAFVLVGVCATGALAEDWVQFRHDYSNTAMSNESSINSSNVGTLAPKRSWVPPAVGTGSTPAVVTINGKSTVFVPNSSGTIYAFAASSGQQLWAVHLPAPVTSTYSSPTVVASTNMLYIGANDGRLHALNATTGAHLWSYPQYPDASSEVYSSPVVYNGVVYFGISSIDDLSTCVAGHVVALNAMTGMKIWDTQTTPPGLTGAGVWASPALDLTNGILYVGTGNANSPCSPASQVPLNDSILAVSMATGVVLGHEQGLTTGGDLDFGSSPVLTTVSYNNQCTGQNWSHGWVIEAKKDGTLYAIQRGGSTGFLGTLTHLNLSSTALLQASPASALSPSSGICQRQPKILGWSALGNALVLPSVANGPLTSPAPVFGISNPYAGGIVLAWTQNPSFGSLSSPVIISDVAIYGGGDNHLHAYNLNGTESWDIAPLDSQIWGSPAISNGAVYIGSALHIYCFTPGGN